MTEQNYPVYAEITGPIVMIGFGSIGRGTLPLIERHFKFDKSRMVVIDPREDPSDMEILKKHGGDIRAENRRDRSGAIFTVRLPLARAR